jgi:hypothetical protein
MVDIDWKELKAKVVPTIWLCLGDDVMYHIMDKESPAAVWLKLESRYISKSLMSKLYLNQWLYSLKMAIVQIYCTRKRTSRVQYNGVQVRGRTHRELYF